MLHKQVGKFLLVGGTSAGIDFLLYSLLVSLTGTLVPIAKAVSFIAGAVFGYLVNRNWTFQSRANLFSSSVSFSLVYLVSFFANVTANSGVLLLFKEKSTLALIVAFTVSTALSATMNFLGMKFLVFRKRQGVRNEM